MHSQVQSDTESASVPNFSAGRAERFGTTYVEPEKRQDMQLEYRLQKHKKEGFKTGLDLFDEV